MNTWRKNLLGLAALLVLLAAPAGAQTADSARAEVAGSQTQAEQQYEDDFDYSSQSLRVGVWLEGKDDGAVIQKGEKFGVGFQTNQDAYAVVYRIDTEGEVSILWPRSRFDDGFVFGGHEYKLPVAGKRRLVAGGEAGEGFVEAIVSSYPFDLRELELDFHHEYADEPYRFQVAGDPFLAMNEVNFVVTGLEDAGDYVVTNYVSYYVHHKVDHPRYLCNQCHFDDEVAFDPYRDNCTLEITVNHEWDNGWWDNYGYYPVYYQPVYVYTDPWTWNPWVNWWYYPRYRCAPTWGWGWNHHYTYWAWYDSPYYRGDCYDYYDRHHHNVPRRYSPLDRHYAASDVRTKSREFSRVSGLVGRKSLDDRQRVAIKDRTPLTSERPGDLRVPTRDRVRRPTSDLRANTRLTGDTSARGGLRIKDNTRVRTGDRTDARHVSGGSDRPAELVPVRGKDPRSGGSTVIRGPGSSDRTRITGDSPRSTGRSSADKPASNSGTVRSRDNTSVRGDKPAGGSRTIKPVEPRRKGTRIWNNPSTSGSTSRSERTPSLSRQRSNSSSSSRKTTVTPSRKNSNSSSNRKTPTVKSSRSKSGSSSGSNQSTPRVRSSNNSSSSKSSGSSSSSNRSSGSTKTRSSGGSSKRR